MPFFTNRNLMLSSQKVPLYIKHIHCKCYEHRRIVCGRDRLSCHDGHQEVSRCHSGRLSLRKYVTGTPLSSANKAAHSGFQTQSGRHQKSKTGV